MAAILKARAQPEEDQNSQCPRRRGRHRCGRRGGSPDSPSGNASGGRRADDAADHIIAAHEFHYSTLENLPADTRFAYRVMRGHGVDGEHDGIIINNLFASYSHLRSMRAYNWAERFAEWVRACRSGNAQARSHSKGEIGVS